MHEVLVEQALKQRMVGAAVIIAIGIIVIPIVLDGAGERQLRKMPEMPQPRMHSKPGFISPEKIPSRADEKREQIVLTLPELDKGDASATDKKKQAPAAVIDSAPPPAPAADKKIIPSVTSKPPAPPPAPVKPKQAETVAKPAPSQQETTASASDKAETWVVQVGSFTDSNKANAVRDELLGKNYPAFVEKVRGRNGQSLYRVMVGSFGFLRDDTSDLGTYCCLSTFTRKGNQSMGRNKITEKCSSAQ